MIFAVAALPGYLLAIARMDRIGRRRLQLAGFLVMEACFAVIGLVPGMTTAVVPFLLAYGISYFFAEVTASGIWFQVCAVSGPRWPNVVCRSVPGGLWGPRPDAYRTI